MFKKNFYIIKIKNYIIPFLFLFFTIGLVLFSNSNLAAAKSGLSLWANSVVPSLLPFFIATELLCSTNLVQAIGNILNPFIEPLFNIRGEGGFALIMGIISGYPTGAKIASRFRKDGICSKEECERLLSFTNNSGPLFIIGTVGISMFGNTTVGLLLFITHILASLTVGIVFRFWKYNASPKIIKNNKQVFSKNYSTNHLKSKNVSLLNLGEIIGASITNSISTILMIGGFVVLFSVVISILKASNLLQLLAYIASPSLHIFSIPEELSKYLITGFLEITNGINGIASVHIKEISINIILTSFLLGFGGISVMLQVLSIISKTDLSPKPYIIGKLLHGIIAAIYTYVFINTFPMFNFDL
ncbi:MAG: sporulation integral membrane protein YlbJ [Clostridia bacterium]|nr:sporulation integral membrane protein YlbJ [Clostridia bacterium]MBR3163623.1 sporulation integral membrane protein YlbJ [Clostridia bacterium]